MKFRLYENVNHNNYFSRTVLYPDISSESFNQAYFIANTYQKKYGDLVLIGIREIGSQDGNRLLSLYSRSDYGDGGTTRLIQQELNSVKMMAESLFEHQFLKQYKCEL